MSNSLLIPNRITCALLIELPLVTANSTLCRPGDNAVISEHNNTATLST